jgi:diguanylate cyclase (GGDEF)-like protein
MRFLADALQIPSWVLFKNQSGALSIVTGVGDYQRYIPSQDLSVGRLSDLPTVNLLGATPVMSANGGIDRRSGGVDPATVAPYGVPLADADGNLFAILCAFGERVAPQRFDQLRPLLDYAAGMLGAVVRTELTLEEATRRTERAQADALVDPLTGLHNRRAWDQLLATEDQRCSRHGYDAVIFVIDLDGLKAVNDRFGHEKGDELIKNAANALERCVRRTDVVARVGGDEFSILAVKCDANAAARIREHIESTMMRANAPATVGFSVRSEAGDLFEAWRQADGAMYHRKRGNPRRGQRAGEAEHAVTPAPADAPDAPTSSAPVAPVTAREPRPAPAPRSAPNAGAESSVVAQILEKVLPALVTGIQKAAPPTPPPPPPTPIFAPPQAPPVVTRPLIVQGEAEIPTCAPPPYTPPAYVPPPAPPEPIAQAAPEPAPIAEPEPAPAPEPMPAPEPTPVPEPPPSSQPSEDLIDIVSRLSRLSDADRRLLDVFFKGSR